MCSSECPNLIESAARPRTYIDPPQDRAEGDTPDAANMHFSADPDARPVKKGSKNTLGYKGCVNLLMPVSYHAEFK